MRSDDRSSARQVQLQHAHSSIQSPQGAVEERGETDPRQIRHKQPRGDALHAIIAISNALGWGDWHVVAHTPTSLVDGTDYFIHRESGNDFLVQITNQSANCGWCIVAHK